MGTRRSMNASALMDDMTVNYSRMAKPGHASVEVVLKEKFFDPRELAGRLKRSDQAMGATLNPEGVAADFAVSAFKKTLVPFQNKNVEYKVMQVRIRNQPINPCAHLHFNMQRRSSETCFSLSRVIAHSAFC